MENLVEDFLQHLRHERGLSEHTQRTYAALLKKFVGWSSEHGVSEWKSVQLQHLMAFLQHERGRRPAREPDNSTRRLSGESVYLEIAALRAMPRTVLMPKPFDAQKLASALAEATGCKVGKS